MASGFFTPEEANALLPAIRPLVERMVQHRRSLARAIARRNRVGQAIAGNGGELHPHTVRRLDEEIEAEGAGLRRCLEAIQELGGIVKDVDRGLVDFPARRGEQEVLLCWQLGEDEIRFWHDLESGFAGRRELPL